MRVRLVQPTVSGLSKQKVIPTLALSLCVAIVAISCRDDVTGPRVSASRLPTLQALSAQIALKARVSGRHVFPSPIGNMEIDHASQTLLDVSGHRIKLPSAVLARLENEFDKVTAIEEYTRSIIADPDYSKCLEAGRKSNHRVRYQIMPSASAAMVSNATLSKQNLLSQLGPRFDVPIESDYDPNSTTCGALSVSMNEEYDALQSAEAAYAAQLAHDDSVYTATSGGLNTTDDDYLLNLAAYWEGTHVASLELEHAVTYIRSLLANTIFLMELKICYFTMPPVTVSVSTQVAPLSGSQTMLRICTYEDTWDSHGYLLSEVLISCRYEV